MSARELGYQVGQIAAPILVIGVAIYIGWRMGQKAEPRKFVVWPVAVAIALVLAGLVGMQMKQAREQQSTSLFR